MWTDGRVKNSGRYLRMPPIACATPSDGPVLQEGLGALQLPCLPFSPAEIFVPGSAKTLHLFEARFLALLDEAMSKTSNMVAHLVMEPAERADASERPSLVASYGCLAKIESVRRLEVGALVVVRGLSRLRLVGVAQVTPFLRGQVQVITDTLPVMREEEMTAKVSELRKVLADVQQLQIKLKSSPNEPLLTPLAAALEWADGAEGGHEFGHGPLPMIAERVSFAALQPFTGASASELHRLIQLRMKAMDIFDTAQRLVLVLEYAQESRASLAAKVALQSLGL